jgi:dTDP-4-dehydrorhamnose reductase
MAKIIILGANGNLGKQLSQVFYKEGNEYEVICWDKEDVDITDKELITDKIEEEHPDIIINAVAYNAVDRCEEDEEEFAKARLINAEAVGYLADACLKAGAVLVHFSSDYVFGGDKKEGYTEADKAEPINKYGKTKRWGEEELISRSGSGLKWYLIRTSKLFGPAGDAPEAKKSFFDKIMEFEKSGDDLNIIHDREISCFTYTPDLAQKTKELLESKEAYGIYHITNSGSASWYRAAKELFQLKDKDENRLVPVNAVDFDRPAKRPKYSILINTKLEPLRSWQEALREYYDIHNS